MPTNGIICGAVAVANKRNYVYVACATDYHKIGVSCMPDARIYEMQIGNPELMSLVLSFEIEDAFHFERRLHDRLAEYHVRGEWFRVGLNVIEDAIADLHKESSETPDYKLGYRAGYIAGQRNG